MLNKNYIIIGIVMVGIVIVAIAAGAIFWPRDDSSTSSTPDTSVLEQGVKNLTRDSAAEMIEIFLKANPVSWLFGGGKTKRYNQNQLGNYAESYMTDSDVQILKNLEAGGFIKILSEENTSASYVIKGEKTIEGKKTLTFDFTDKATPYFVKREGVSPDDKDVDVLLAELVSVEVTGLTEQAINNGVNTRIANYTAKYEPTPIGKIVDEKKAGEEVKWQMPFALYDDGWRIQLLPGQI